MTRPASAEDLHQSPIFHGFDHAERRQLLELMTSETYPEGHEILEEGRSTQSLWILVRGRCAVLKDTRTRGEQQLAVLEPWGVFGEMSFFNPAPHSASIRTLTEVEVLRLSRERYNHLLDACSKAAYKLALNVIGVLAQRLRRMDDWTCDLVESPDGQAHKEEWREFRSRLFSDWQF